MSTGNETINKLSEALSTLIVAYEKLQKDNKDLKDEVTTLKSEKEQIITEKEQVVFELNTLKEDVNVLSDNSEQQNNSMYSMLDKIESLLGDSNKVTEEKSNDVQADEIVTQEIENIINDQEDYKPEIQVSNNVEKEKEVVNDSSESNKIDLNRMASLLNGFNK